jgi:hypothetical protein
MKYFSNFLFYFNNKRSSKTSVTGQILTNPSIQRLSLDMNLGYRRMITAA